MIDNTEKPIFATVIRSSQISQDSEDWKVDAINKGVPIEIVIMQLKSLIRNYENNYFDNFDSKIKN